VNWEKMLKFSEFIQVKLVNFILLLISSLLHNSLLTNSNQENYEKKIVIVAASYNNANWYKHHLNSVFTQKYKELIALGISISNSCYG